MLKRIEHAWNSRTPVYLHNGTKENIIFQISLTVLIILGFTVADKVREYLDAHKYAPLKNTSREL